MKVQRWCGRANKKVTHRNWVDKGSNPRTQGSVTKSRLGLEGRESVRGWGDWSRKSPAGAAAARLGAEELAKLPEEVET